MPVIVAPRFPVIALGGSAGALAAFTEFFAGLADSDAALDGAFIVIPHLLPGAESHMAELLQKHSPYPVTQVSGPTEIEMGHVYFLKPGETLDVEDASSRR